MVGCGHKLGDFLYLVHGDAEMCWRLRALWLFEWCVGPIQRQSLVEGSGGAVEQRSVNVKK